MKLCVYPATKPSAKQHDLGHLLFVLETVISLMLICSNKWIDKKPPSKGVIFH